MLPLRATTVHMYRLHHIQSMDGVPFFSKQFLCVVLLLQHYLSTHLPPTSSQHSDVQMFVHSKAVSKLIIMLHLKTQSTYIETNSVSKSIAWHMEPACHSVPGFVISCLCSSFARTLHLCTSAAMLCRYMETAFPLG